MADVKFSEFQTANDTDPIEGVGLQNGSNVKFPSAKAYFIATSEVDIPIGVDEANPSFLGPITMGKSNGIAVFDSATGSVINNTGRTIKLATGTLSFTPNKGGGGTTNIHIVSERSADGIATFTPNSNSLRVAEFANNGESFQTKLSFVEDWLDGEVLRFRAYVFGGGSITFESPSDTISGDLYTGPSLAWELSEK